MKLENGVYYCFRQSVDVFRTVVVQPLHRHVEQHSRIQIGHVGRFFGVVLAKRRNEIFVEVVKIQVLQPCLSQQFEGLLVLQKQVEHIHHHLDVVFLATGIETFLKNVVVAVVVALSLLTSSIVYIAFMARLFFVQRTPSTYTLNYVVLLAFIAFAELGFAVAGMIRTKRKGLYYRNIKIANMGMALIAILTTQMSLLDFTGTKNTDIYNAFSGIAVGLFIALSALYVFFAPKISLVGRESNVFVGDGTQTVATDGQGNVKILLVSSRVYGSYVYVAKLDGKTLSGEIRQEASLWKKMHVALKILCCVLSEILIFVWLAGYLVFFLRCINLPAQLERKMKTLNFSKPDLQKTISSQCAIAETPDM